MSDLVPLATGVTGSGPGLLLVHGITEDRTFWGPVVTLLADHATVVSVDLRGHGQSAQADSYGLAAMAADVHAAWTATGVAGDPLVVGHSLGGLLAAVYAGRWPTRGVVDVDQPLALGGMQGQLLQAEPMLRGPGFEAFMAGLFDSMRGVLDDEAAAALAARRRPVREVVTGIWSPLLDDTPGELAGMVEDIAAAVRVPFLSLHGLDPGPDYADWLTARIPTATVEVWTDDSGAPLGHHPHLVQPERFVARVQEFADSL
ncbi:MAG: alpha/beta hydrolase fold [Klenkia sp.]|nr:alpha/beta hydrolase fold [Klenkia sp.]